jgi:phosphoglucosamine mutase
VANVEPMTAEMALEIGRAAAYVCKRTPRERHQILIGKDTRQSGYMLENALTAGICSMGVDVLLVGPIPTPGVAFLTKSMRADAGIVISASHNPYQDNGIKLFSRAGFKLPDPEEEEIEDLILSKRIHDIRATAEEVGKASRIDDAMGRYIVFCKSTFPDEFSLENMKLVLDCANGATYRVAPTIFRELGAEVIALNTEPNGTNINADCGSQHTEGLRAAVIETGADAGLAFDGDGDRLIAVDEQGQELSGDQIMTICADYYKKRGMLSNNLLVSTVMSNFGLGVALDALGIARDASQVGDRYVVELMLQRGAVLGGEESGHLIFLNHHTTGDGIISALQLLSGLRAAGTPLSEQAALMSRFPQTVVNVDVPRKPPLEQLPSVMEAITSAEAELASQGRVLVRYSGTQSMCRVMVEGPTEDLTKELADRLALAVREAIPADG